MESQGNKKTNKVYPYNFIPFPRKKASKYSDFDKHYGVIEYTVKTKTPLFIPNTSNDNVFDVKDKNGNRVDDHKTYDFFSYEDLSKLEGYSKSVYEPVIPGSEMRGAVRSVYETLTDSCMGLLNAEQKPLVNIRYEPGLLYWEEDGTISLVNAQIDLIEKTNELLKKSNGQQISIKKKGKIKNGSLLKFGFESNDENQIENYQVLTVKNETQIRQNLDVEKTKSAIVNVINSSLSSNTCPEDEKKRYEEYKNDFIQYLDKKGASEKDGYFPINYRIVDSKVRYSPTPYAKEEAQKTLGKYAKEFAPCSNEDNLCPACDLFGNVSGEFSKSSKIRFADLRIKCKKLNSKDYYEEIKTLQNLSSPQIGNWNNYLEKPNDAISWTYDYYIDKREKKILCDSKLHGRKYYWHHQKVEFKKVEPTNQNKTIRPVKKDIFFKGELYFDGISEKQLKQLIYILNSGNENLGMKLGMGKPLGLGSISCLVTNVKERCISIENNTIDYVTKQYNFNGMSSFKGITYKNAEFSESVRNKFEQIASFNYVPVENEINYTAPIKKGRGLAWFKKKRY